MGPQSYLAGPSKDDNLPPSFMEVRSRRVRHIILEAPKGNVQAWLSSLGANGKWPDNEVNYATGCAARRANWPAQVHWRRILTMAAAWHDGTVSGASDHAYVDELKIAISNAMDYWFQRDFQNIACLDRGGTKDCPCEPEGPDNHFWNTNWYANVILIPNLAAQSCLLVGSENISPFQLDTCKRMSSRAYNFHGRPRLTGANLLDTARIGMDLALLTGDTRLLADAYGKAHGELKIVNEVRADGIRADGAFAQHTGILYNGNYGKDYANDALRMEIDAAGTEYAADVAEQAALETQFEGNKWMITRNTVTGVLHWDFSVLGRFISFPVADNQATASININLDRVIELGKLWDSRVLLDFAKSLSEPTAHANAGNLLGNRSFYTNDYMVHRGTNYVSTLKMWSKRTKNTEWTNSQNPLGFHLADGVNYTYIRGDEYEDIAAAWDWNIIPGITTDYGTTSLTKEHTKLLGDESFVGAVSDGQIGIAAMRYTNPVTKKLKWQKAWFFLENDVQHVMVANLASKSGKPVYSVLDQRKKYGEVIANGSGTDESSEGYSMQTVQARSLWHGDLGYTFQEGTKVTFGTGSKKGDWRTIGTSKQPSITVDTFAAWIEHEPDISAIYPPIAYSVFPGADYAKFTERSAALENRLQRLRNDKHVSGVYDKDAEVLMAVFWDAKGGDVSFKGEGDVPAKVTVDGNGAILYRLKTSEVTVADPGQTLEVLTVRIWLTGGMGDQGGAEPKTLLFKLPNTGTAGSSVTLTF